MKRIVVSIALAVLAASSARGQSLMSPAQGVPLARPKPGVDLSALRLYGHSDIKFLPTERVEAFRYTLGEAAKWSAQVVFAPTEAAKMKLLYVYDSEDCLAFNWASLDTDWGRGNVVLAFMRPEEIRTVAPSQLWSIDSIRFSGARAAPDLLRSDGSKVCQAARTGGYWIVMNTPLPNTDYKVKLFSRAVVIPVGITFRINAQSINRYGSPALDILESELLQEIAAKLGQVLPQFKFDGQQRSLMIQFEVLEEPQGGAFLQTVLLDSKSGERITLHRAAVAFAGTYHALSPEVLKKRILMNFEVMLKEEANRIDTWFTAHSW